MSSEADPGGNRSLDETDVRILRLLEANGRASYEEIARYVHLSANAVRGRVQALTRLASSAASTPTSTGMAAGPRSQP
jgi:predicted ArsR family transcriptional regulator